VYLNVQLDPQRRQTTISHEAAVRAGQTYHLFYMVFVRKDSGEVRSLMADRLVAASGPGERRPDVLLDAEEMRHLAEHLRVRWKNDKEFRVRTKCLGSRHWPGRLRAVSPIREPRWTCVETVKTGTSSDYPAMRVMFDNIRNDSVILHSVAVKLWLRTTGRPEWLTCEGEDPRDSSCKYLLPVLDWKGHEELIKARGVSYTTPSEAREAPEGAWAAFPEVAREDLKVSQ
jgi:hypothetical protein